MILLPSLLDRWRFHLMAFVISVDGGGLRGNGRSRTRANSLRVHLKDCQRSARATGSRLRLACLAHLPANALALATFLGARLHNFTLALLALVGAAAARLGASLVGEVGQRARASRQAGGEGAERLAVHRQFMRFGVMLAMLRVIFGELLETVVSGFVAGLCTLPDRLDVLAHVTVSLAVRRTSAPRARKSPAVPAPSSPSSSRRSIIVSCSGENPRSSPRTLVRSFCKQLLRQGSRAIRDNDQ